MNIYAIDSMKDRIAGNSYVGRGIVIGRSKDGSKAVIAYFIMGRSENSRNRVFVPAGEDLMIRPFDESKVEDPSLIIYYPVRKFGSDIIVTNGDQTDTVYNFVKEGKSFEDALMNREFEPDGPNWTPRISGMIKMESNGFSYKLSILKSANEEGSSCSRYFFNYEGIPGLGHFIHTYVQDGNPIPTFQGEPARVAIPEKIDDFTNEIWNNLDENNKISLYVRYIDIKTGKSENRLINKNK